MSTATIRLDGSLKACAVVAAQRAGRTPYALIVGAIEATVRQIEIDVDFEQVAGQRSARLRTTGETVSWDDAKRWFETRALGRAEARPRAKRQLR